MEAACCLSLQWNIACHKVIRQQLGLFYTFPPQIVILLEYSFSLSLPDLYKGQQDQLVVALWTCILMNLREDTVENQCVLPVSLNDVVRPGRRGDWSIWADKMSIVTSAQCKMLPFSCSSHMHPCCVCRHTLLNMAHSSLRPKFLICSSLNLELYCNK